MLVGATRYTQLPVMYHVGQLLLTDTYMFYNKLRRRINFKNTLHTLPNVDIQIECISKEPTTDLWVIRDTLF